MWLGQNLLFTFRFYLCGPGVFVPCTLVVLACNAYVVDVMVVVVSVWVWERKWWRLGLYVVERLNGIVYKYQW